VPFRNSLALSITSRRHPPPASPLLSTPSSILCTISARSHWFYVTFKVCSLAHSWILQLRFYCQLWRPESRESRRTWYSTQWPIHPKGKCTPLSWTTTLIRTWCGRKSGPGDHGKDGIKNFLTTHECNSKCEALGLDELDSDDEESDKE
jgi:hypothetical protein